MGAVRRACAIVLTLALGACAATPGTEEPKLATEIFTHQGRERTVLVHDFSGGRRAPVVIVMHGGGGNAANAVMMTGFDDIAMRERFIAVYPNGTNGPAGPEVRTWNAGHCCAAAMRGGVDDVGFLAALIDRLIADGRADPARIYATGMSNGAMMSHRAGRELSTRIAAIAPVVGAVFGDERPAAGPVAALIITGAIDRTVPGEGGPIGQPASFASGSADRNAAPAAEQAAYWARANGCGAASTRKETAATVTRYAGCRKPVLHYVVDDNGHAWPGGRAGRAEANQPTQAFDASEVIWAFFKQNPRRR